MTVVKRLVSSVRFAAVMLAVVVDFTIAVEVRGICDVSFEQVAMSTAVSSRTLVHVYTHQRRKEQVTLESERGNQQTYHFVQ